MDIDRNIEDIIQTNMMDFSQYVIKHRALPDLYSGMKPIHSKILWSMYENKTFNFTKSANVSGKVTVYSPHGDCYETIVNMVQKDRHKYNLILGRGNWGSNCSTELMFGASRYTECALSDLGIDCLKGIDSHMVEMIDNYDNSKTMPKYIPTRFPLILCMASNGIAVGMANNSPSFNLEDVCLATINYLQDKEMPILYPDFATGAYLIDNSEQIKNINHKGLGVIKLRAKYEVVENTIRITEIPYGTKINVEVIIDRIIEKCKSGELKEITDVLNHTGIDGLCIEITFKKNIDINLLMNKLFKLTALESNFNANMNVLVNGSPKILGVHDTIKNWVVFRQECIKNGLSYKIENLKKELHLLYSLKKVLLDIDKAIEIIRYSDDIESKIMQYFDIDKIQSEYIVNIKLRNINKDYIIKQINDIEKIELELKKHEETILSEKAIKKIIIEDLKDVIKKFKQPRRTQIIQESTISQISESDLIEDHSTFIILTKENYIKKLLKRTSDVKLKESDEIIYQSSSSNKSTLLLFSNKGTCYKIYQHELAECKPSSLGEYLPNLLNLSPDERIISMVSTRKYTGYLINSYQNGKISKINMSSFRTKTMRSKLENALSLESPLINMLLIEKDIDMLCKSSLDKVLIINTSDINSKASKNTNGNQVLKSKKESYMNMCLPLETITGIEDVEYYKGKPNAIGTFLKKTDKIELI